MVRATVRARARGRTQRSTERRSQVRVLPGAPTPRASGTGSSGGRGDAEVVAGDLDPADDREDLVDDPQGPLHGRRLQAAGTGPERVVEHVDQQQRAR